MLRKRISISLIALPMMAFSCSARSEDMTKADKAREAALIAKLEAGEIGGVIEDDGGLRVMWVNTDEHFKFAAQLQRMTRLHAAFCGDQPLLSGPELRHLRGHKNLRHVDIVGMPISGKEYEVFQTLPNLQVLGCTLEQDVIEGMRNIAKCKGLRDLYMEYSKIPDECLEPLAELVNLEELRLSDLPISSGVRVVRHMQNLRELSLRDTEIDDDVLKTIAGLPKLEKLFFGSPNVTNSGVAYLAKSATLHTLAIDCPKVDSRGVATLASLRQLRYLDLDAATSDDALIDALSELKQITRLMCHAGIPKKSPSELEEEIEKIYTLDYEALTRRWRQTFSDRIPPKLSKALPNCEISWVEPKK